MENQVCAHYDSNDLKDRVFSALEKAKKNITHLELSDLAPIDQLHTGGAKATLDVLEQAGLAPESDILDAGCGIGGSSRLMAINNHHRVWGIDLSDPFIETAQALTDSTHLSDRVTFKQGSVTHMPFEDSQFDAVLCQHVLMNIEDKKKTFGEFYRVLKPGAKLILHEVVKGESEPVLYPVPWAANGDISFMDSARALTDLIRQAGFTADQIVDGTPKAANWWARAKQAAAKKPVTERLLGPHLVLGENARFFGENMSNNIEWDRIRVIEAVFVKGKI